MSRGIFVTGGSGFVGRRLLAVLGSAGQPIVALDRSGTIPADPGGRITVVRGDVTQPDSYRAHLIGCDTVVHLAAATGRAAASEHLRINAKATEALVEESRRAGVERFLFVSSIAAVFPDLQGYAYGLSKVEGERAVRDSGLRFAILRPTMIMGPGAPILAALEKLATLPAIVLPGNGGARVQPIHVDDVARAIAMTVRNDMFSGGVFEIGGPAVMPIEELLQLLRQARLGARGRVIRIPLGLMQPPLRIVEAAGLLSMLPISAGQLSSFRYDGVASANELQQRLAADLLPGVVQAKVAPPLSDLGKECDTLTRYLIGQEADEHVRATYLKAHERVAFLHVANRFDGLLLKLASGNRLLARAADSYSSVFARDSVLRKKLVLLLAILETSPPYYHQIDIPASRSRGAFFIQAAIGAVAFVAILWISSLLLLPAQVLLSHKERVAA